MHPLIALLSALLVGVSSNDASILFAKHTQYVGWQAGDGSLQGWIASGTRTNGHVVDPFNEKRSGVAYRDTLTTANGQISEQHGFSGTMVWSSNPNGYVVKEAGPAAQLAYDLNLIRAESLSYIPQSTVTGSARAGGVNAAVIHVSPPGAPPMDVYEDPATGAFVQAVIDPQGSARTVVTIEAYGDAAPGKKVMTRWTAGNLHYELTSVAAQRVADAELLPPQPKPVWTFGNGAVPIDMYDLSTRRYQPRVTLSVNGVSGVFVIDTSTPAIVLFDNFARRAGVTAIDGADFSSFSGNARYAGYGLVRTLTAGDNTLRNVLIERISAPDNRIAGLLGYDFFAGAIAEVDLSTKRMELFNPGSMQPVVAAGAYAFPLDLTSRRPVIGIHLSGNAYGFPYFSTGEPFFMMLSQSLRESGAVSASDVSTEHFNPKAGSRGFFGTMIESDPVQLAYSDYTGAYGSGNCVLLHQALIGPYRYESPPLCFIGSGVFGDAGGAIGNDFLHHFDWTIDYPDATFVLTPNNAKD